MFSRSTGRKRARTIFGGRLFSGTKISFWILSSYLLLPLTYANESLEATSLTVKSAVEIAVRDNPNLAQLQERYKALSEVPSQVGSLPDPMINVNAMNFPITNFHRRQEAMTQVQIGITQAFPFPGKLSLKEEVAEFEAQAASHSVDELRLQLISGVRNRWWQVYYLDQALETIYSNQKLFREFIKIARTKYETGSGLQQDVLLAQLELSQLMDHEIQVKAMRRNQAIALNVLMDMPTRDTVNLSQGDYTELSELRSRQSFFKQAEASRPLLRQKKTEIDAASSRLKFAEKNVLPDFSIGVTYGDRTGDNPPFMGGSRDNLFSLMFGVKVPLYRKRKQAKAIDQRAAELQRSYYASQDEKGKTMGAISTAITDYNRAREEFSLFETGIIPQASQTVQSMLAGYQVNEVDFLNLVRSQITLLNYQLQYWKALTEAKQSLARLEAAVGEETIYE